MISEKTKAEYFCAKDWTTQIRLMRLAKLDFVRRLSAGPAPVALGESGHHCRAKAPDASKKDPMETFEPS